MKKLGTLGIALVLAFAAFGGLACGGDDGDGGSNGDVCADPQSDACKKCAGALFACMMAGTCPTETATLTACEDGSGCDEDDEECLAAHCGDEINAWVACMKSECPDAAGCIEAP